MRKGTGIALIVISVLLVGTSVVLYSKYRTSETNYQQTRAEDETNRAHYGQAIGEIATIQDSLNAIVLGEQAVQSMPARGESEVETPGTLHDQVLTRITTLKGAIERTKERITELDAKLKRNGIKIAGLEKMIAGLRKSVADKEDRIAQLNTQVDTLQTQVSGLTVAVQDKDQQITQKQQEIAQNQQEIAQKQQELATIFYTIGSKKQLVHSGLAVAQGGVLGLGKTLKPSGHFDEASFTPLDTDQETVIHISAKKAQVLTAQPVSSYVLQPVGTDAVELRIVDPKEFRKVKQVVILTT
jgi:predicted RNase H-like nuclease (RuvC/YqgF family)